MTDKPLHIVLFDLLVAAAAVAGIFLALKTFRIPNCTSVGKHALFMWVPRLSLALAAAAAAEFVVGGREASRLSKAIASLALFASILLWVICRWKVNSILALAC